MLAHLIDRLTEALIKGEEACQTAKCKSTDSVYCQNAADNCTKYIADISDLCTGRHQNIGKFIGIVRTLKQLVIQFVKFTKTLLLMAENLNNLLALHHLLNISVYNTKVLLLFHKVLTTKTGKIFAGNQHNPNHKQCHNGKRYIQNNHTYQNADNGNHTGNQLWNTLTDHLTQGVNIICINGHDITVCMRIKIFNRQGLHTLKHLISKIAQSSLTDINHQPVICIGAAYTNGIKAGNSQDCHSQRVEIRCL